MQGDGPKNIGQLYRGQVSLANTWRSRLDRTTNWSVVVTAAVTTWSFSSPDRNHLILLLGGLMIFFFMLVEARRYRHFEVWRARVRIIEQGYFADVLDASTREKVDWKELLAEDLIRPAHGIGFLEAVGRRFKRVYVWILLVLYMAWLAKIWIHPVVAPGFGTVMSRANVGALPGIVIFSVVTGTMVSMGLISVFATRSREAKGEIRDGREKAEGWKD